jgi:hypothetical protein
VHSKWNSPVIYRRDLAPLWIPKPDVSSSCVTHEGWPGGNPKNFTASSPFSSSPTIVIWCNQAKPCWSQRRGLLFHPHPTDLSWGLWIVG